ncbi:hypothetical protein ACFQZI_06885 [Mucilaginibacter lutimaris]|uniref:Uncharacterized protein n=1 Tax=Mucilaginibacter lutimaris TaxID=931629 RepID=A0ABW2ZEF3_9SPHI
MENFIFYTTHMVSVLCIATILYAINNGPENSGPEYDETAIKTRYRRAVSSAAIYVAWRKKIQAKVININDFQVLKKDQQDQLKNRVQTASIHKISSSFRKRRKADPLQLS